MNPNESTNDLLARLQKALLDLTCTDPRDLDATLRTTLAVDARTLEVERVSYWEYTADRRAVVCRLLHRLSTGEYSSGTTLSADRYPRYFAALGADRVVAADYAETDPRTSEYRDDYLAPNGIGAMMDVPVWRHGAVHGIVCHEHVGSNRHWFFGEQLFAASVANCITVALEARGVEDSEARYRDLFQRIPVGLYRSTHEGRILAANPAIAKMLGFPDVETLMRIGSTESLYATPGDRAGWIEEVERSDVVLGREMRFLRRDGTPIWVRNSARAVRDSSGRMTHFEGALESLDESKEARRTLAAEHATTKVLADAPRLADAVSRVLRAIAQSLDCEWGAFWLVNSDGSSLELFESWSPPEAKLADFEAVTRATGFPPGVGLPGRAWQSNEPCIIRDVTVDPGFPRRAAAALCGLRGAFAFPVQVDDETIGVAEFLSREIRRATPELLMMARTLGSQLAQFIRRQRAETALAESERTLKSIFDSLDRVFWSADLESGRVTQISRAAESIYGLAPQRVLESPSIWREVVIAEDGPIAEEAAARIARGETVTTQYRIRRGDGEIRWLEVHMKRVERPDGKPVLDGMAADVTERRLAEQRLEDALARAQESDRLKSAFLSNMSHEIRTPINVIAGFVDVLQGEIEADDPRQQYFDAMRRAGDRLVNTMHSILEVARLETSAFEYRPVPLAIAAFVEKRTRRHEGSIRSKGLTLTVEIDEPAAMVSFDAYCLERALDQLLDNAVKFTTEGGITVRVRGGADGFVAVDVSDTGIGIDDAYRPRLFEAFSQEDTGYRRRFEGSGLGLSLVKRFMELGHGWVSVDSKKGEGSTFALHFPRWAGAGER